MRTIQRTRQRRSLRGGVSVGPRLLRVEALEDRRLLTAARAADAVNLFAIDVYEQMQREGGNLFFSPLSVATGLAMAYAGANGQTATEMEQVLHLSDEPGIHESFGDLIDSIKSHNDYLGWQFTWLANAVWPDLGLPVEQAFLDVAQTEYGGHVQGVDYSNPEQAKDIINSWVADNTFGKIPNLVSDVGDAVMVLTNAVYFNGYWELPFDPDYTAPRPFTNADGQVSNVPTMYTETFLPYAEIDGFQVLVMPFDAGANDADNSMVFVLPPVSGSQEMTPDLYAQIDAWLDTAPPDSYVLVTLPKIDTAVATSLNSLLMGLGMPTAFELGAADFSQMTPAEVAISKVFHKATLTVNEQGTTAAAATEVQFYICFAAGTPVLTPAGSTPIEQLKAGDLVYARDENNPEGELQPKVVEKVHFNQAEILEVYVREQVIRTTAAHPFFVKGKGWTPAGELRSSDELATSFGDWVQVDGIERTSSSEAVYNLRVADHHTYFIGSKEWEFAVWVHNNCGGEPEFFADRPFHLLIRDNITGTVAFMGRIDDPSQLANSVTPTYVAAANADFDGNQTVNGADFLAWQRGYGATTGAQLAEGDSDADGDVDADDLAHWEQAFGETQTPATAAALVSDTPSVPAAESPEPAATAELVDAAMAIQWLQVDADGEAPSNAVAAEIAFAEHNVSEADDVLIATPSQSYARDTLRSDEEGDDDFVGEPWLNDELLEVVFE